jgi:flagellar assembly factor FliW
MNIDTTRFGKIEIRESELIVMKGSILGFEHLKRFVLLVHDEKTPLCWLQSIEDPALAFVVVNPRIIKLDYNPVVDEGELKFLDITNSDDLVLLAIVTVRSHPLRVTANLRAPILINAANRTANQVVLDDPDYPIQYDILGNRADIDSGQLSGKCKVMEGPGKLASIAAPI